MSGSLHTAGPVGALKRAICEETARLCGEQYRDHLRSIVLTGSLARNEGTFIKQGERWDLLGDTEFLLVFHENASLPSRPVLTSLGQRIEAALLRDGLLCHTTLSSVHPVYLRRMPPHIFGYELRSCGQVIEGDSEILSLIPVFSASDIPLEDAWRLLCNRMIEQLEVVDDLANGYTALPQRVQYRVVKLYLDMATSFLLFAGGYEPSYAQRAEKLRILADTPLPDSEYPFPPRRFAQQVASCTRLKLTGTDLGVASVSSRQPDSELAFWEEAVAHARLLWRWELERLTDTRVQLSNRALWERWAQRQTLSQRLRGWLYVLRRQGWHRSWREWIRWGRHGWQASPRYWVYAAASELFFELPCLLRSEREGPEGSLDWKELRSWLPVAGEAGSGEKLSRWRQLTSEIVWNYYRFLVETRA